MIGSLIGVLLFTILSFFWTPPIVWLSISFFFLIIFLYNFELPIKFSTISFLVLILVLISADRSNVKEREFYSPYQNISVLFNNDERPIEVRSSHIWFQHPINFSNEYFQSKHQKWFYFYNFPFKISKEKPKDIMIVGSGTGNDVAAALRSGVQNVDAVEIDPVIAELGKHFHPESPYSSNKVNLFVNDARNSIKYSKKNMTLFYIAF
mgnify:FL=1